MSNFRIAPQADEDISQIYRHIAKDNLPAADDWLDRLYDRLALIAHNPQMGELRAELSPNLRIMSFGNYVIFFRPNQTGIEIARMLHGSRDIEAIFRDQGN
jgi:toxin ParE1/3/4